MNSELLIQSSKIRLSKKLNQFALTSSDTPEEFWKTKISFSKFTADMFKAFFIKYPGLKSHELPVSSN